jgi:hypothetical protein
MVAPIFNIQGSSSANSSTSASTKKPTITPFIILKYRIGALPFWLLLRRILDNGSSRKNQEPLRGIRQQSSSAQNPGAKKLTVSEFHGT